MKTGFYAPIVRLVAALSLLTGASAALAQRPAPPPAGCGEINNLYGPFDYRTAHESRRALVENAHFPRGVQTLTKRATGEFGHDIGYTLAVFPNHHRAILVMERLSSLERSDPPRGADMTIDCYYARGMAYTPDDHVFRMLYVSFLIRRDRLDEANKFLDYVVAQADDNPLTLFNAGMLFVDMKNYDKALIQAHKVMALGMTRPELRERLTAVGRWVEPDAKAGSAPDDAASQPSR